MRRRKSVVLLAQVLFLLYPELYILHFTLYISARERAGALSCHPERSGERDVSRAVDPSHPNVECRV